MDVQVSFQCIPVNHLDLGCWPRYCVMLRSQGMNWKSYLLKQRCRPTSPSSGKATTSSLPRHSCLPALPLRGSAGRQTKQPVAHPYLLGYTEAWLKSGRRLPMPRGLLHCATGLQGLVPVGDGVSELRIHYGPGYRVYLTKQADADVILFAGGDKSSQDMDIRLAKDLARNL